MASMYSTAKKVYLKVQNIPTLGNLLSHLAPLISKITKKLDFWTSPRFKSQKEFEILSQALVALRDSVKGSIQQIQMLVEDYHNQIDIYRERLEFVRLEILEQYRTPKQKAHGKNIHIKQEIINKKKYDSMLATNNVVVNIGCGHKSINEALNIDRRNLPGVDIVADATNLPFTCGTISEIYAAHLVEHFTLHTLKNEVFPYWFDMLAKEGIVKIIVPDTTAMIIAYTKGEMSFSDFSDVTLGAQDYDDDFHFSMFSPQILQNMLITSGFQHTEIIATNRINGKCREMEIWARKF